MRCNDVLSVALGLALVLASAGACPIPNVRRVDSRRKRWSGRRGLLDDGKQACRRRVRRDRQQSLVHGCERDHERGLLSAPRCPQHGGHAVHHHGRFDLRRSRTRRDKPCDLDADWKTRSSILVTNTDKRQSPKYRITNTYVTDPSRDTLLIRTRFESLDGGVYQLYLHANPSIAGGGANNSAWWDGTHWALMASGTRTLFGSPMTIVSALKVGSPNGFVANDNGFATVASDCDVELHKDMALVTRFDSASNGNVVQCGEIGAVGADTTFTVALGYGGDAASALAAAEGSLAAGFPDREAAYRKGWSDYVDGLRPAPASVSTDTLRRRVYYVAAMALHAAEDKTFRGASVAGFATPWGDFVNGDQPNDGYHRVWGRDLYQQATGLIAAGDSAQALRMAQFLWNAQFIGATTPGDGTTYAPGSLPRYSPVSGSSAATSKDLGCCEQLDEEAFAILLAWMTGLTDNATLPEDQDDRGSYRGGGAGDDGALGGAVRSISVVDSGDHRRARRGCGHRSPEQRPCERRPLGGDGRFVAFEPRRLDVHDRWDTGAVIDYYERIDPAQDPNGPQTLHFNEGNFFAHDVADFGFLDLVRLGVVAPDDTNVSTSLAPSAAASDGNSTVQVTMPNGDIYFHRYNHDNYGESDSDCTGWPADPVAPNRYGRFWPVLSGERGEYEIANGRSAAVYLKSMADAANDGYFVPEQVWDRADIACFTAGRPTGSAAPLNWAEGQYLRLAQSIDAGYDLDTPSVVKAKYRGAGPILGAAGKCIDDAGASTDNGSAIQVWPVTGRARRAGPGTAATGRSARSISAWTSPAARPPAERRSSSGSATAQALRNGAGDSRAAS